MNDDSLRGLFAKRAERRSAPPSFDVVHAAFVDGDRRDGGRWRHALAAFAVAASVVLGARSGWLRSDPGHARAAASPIAIAGPSRASLGGVCREGEGVVEPLVCRDTIDAETSRLEPSVAEIGGFSRAPATLLSCGTE